MFNMKKYIAAACIVAVALTFAACADNGSTVTPSASQQATETVSQGNTDAPTVAPSESSTAPTNFQDLASLELIRDAVIRSAEKTVFVYDYEPGYDGKTVTGFSVEQVMLSGEQIEYSVSMEKDDITFEGHEYIVRLEVNGEFEEDEIYPFIINLTVTYDDGTTASITDFFSYESESFT